MNKFSLIETPHCNWLNIPHAGSKEISYLRGQFHFTERDLAEAPGSVQALRPKIRIHNDYAFLVFLYPVYNKKTKQVRPAEIDFFLTNSHLVSLHNDDLSTFNQFLQQFNRDQRYKKECLIAGPASLLYEILHHLIMGLYSTIDHLGQEISLIEKDIFLGNEKRMVNSILISKRSIINTRRILQSHKTVLKRLSQEDMPFFSRAQMGRYYNQLIDHTKFLWEILDNHMENIESLENTNNSLLNIRTNNVIKTLTVMSFVVFPLTLLAGIFGMNTVVSMPLINHPYGFWIIVGLMIAALGVMFTFFKHKRWLE